MCAKSFLAGAVFVAMAIMTAASILNCCATCCQTSGTCTVPPGCCSEQCHKDLEARVEKLERAKTGSAETE